MTDTPRRQLLRAIGGLTAITSLAGCSSLPGGDSGGDGSGGDSGSSEARTWLYDPTQWTDTPSISVSFKALSALAAEREYINPIVREAHLSPFGSVDLDPKSTDWELFQRAGAYESPSQTVYSGTFEEDVARSSIAATDDPTLRDDGSIGDLQAVSDDEGFAGAYNDETIVSLTGENSRPMVEDAVDGTNRLSDVGEDIVSLLDRLGFDHTLSVDLRRTSEDGWSGTATAHRIEGERTRVRLVGLGQDWEEDVLRDALDIEETTIESVNLDGPVQWGDMTAPTYRLPLDGSVFTSGLFTESS